MLQMQHRPTLSHSLLAINQEEYARNYRVSHSFMAIRNRPGSMNSWFACKKTTWNVKDSLLMVQVGTSVFQTQLLYTLICKTIYQFDFCVLFWKRKRLFFFLSYQLGLTQHKFAGINQSDQIF